MKYLILSISVLAMVSCNTSIGVWRDTKVGYNWTKERIQGAGSASSDEMEYEYGAPIY